MRRLIYFVLIAAMGATGCKKEMGGVSIPEVKNVALALPPIRPVIPFPLKLSFVCVGSYEELLNTFGGNPLPVRQIILEDNSVIVPDGVLLAVEYALQPSSGGNSAFDSLLWIRYLQGSLIRTHYSQVWSLGCPLKTMSGGPYTNLQRGGQTYEVNTSFSWTAPPYTSDGPRIKYLVLE